MYIHSHGAEAPVVVCSMYAIVSSNQWLLISVINDMNTHGNDHTTAAQYAGFLISFFCKTEAQISRILTSRIRQREYIGGRNVCIGIPRNLTLRFCQREYTGGRNVIACIPRILTPKFRGRDFKTFSPTQYTSLPCPAQCLHYPDNCVPSSGQCLMDCCTALLLQCEVMYVRVKDLKQLKHV